MVSLLASSTIYRGFEPRSGQTCDDDGVCFVLDQHTELDFYTASSLKQQSADRHAAPLWHIILILSQSVFALSLIEIYGDDLFSYLTDFSYFSMERNCRKLLDTVRTVLTVQQLSNGLLLTCSDCVQQLSNGLFLKCSDCVQQLSNANNKKIYIVYNG
jgi:hypothetical protein